MAGFMICINASGVTAGGNNKDIIALNGKNGDIPLEGVGPAPYFYDHHSIAQEAVGFDFYGRPATNAEWESGKADFYAIGDARNRRLLGGAYVATDSEINFGAFKNGMYQITGFTVTRTGNSGEGAAIYVDLTTLAIPTGFTIYWTITAISGAAQNGMTPASGSTVITSTAPGNWPGTAARITLTPDPDNITEGDGSFIMQIRQGGVSGTVFYTSGAIAVSDTSKYPYIYKLYKMGACSSYPGNTWPLREGVTEDVFFVNGYDITGARSPATYYWSLDNAARFVTSSGPVVVTDNYSPNIALSPRANLTTDGATTVTLSLRLTSVTGPIISSKTFTLIDDSLNPAFTAPTGAVSINEGSAQSFSVSGYTEGATYAATWYWRINHITTVAADFVGSVVSGTFTINNGGSFTITPVADSLSEGTVSGNRLPARNETFSVIISRTSGGTAVATSPTITINDTSLSAPSTITWTFSTDNAAQTINLDTPVTQGSATRTGGPYVVGVSGNIMNIVIPAGIQLSGGLTITGGNSTDVVNVTVNGGLTARGGSGVGTCAVGNPGGVGLNFSGMVPAILNLGGSGTIAGGGGAGGGSTVYSTEVGGGAGGTIYNGSGVHGSPLTCRGFFSDYGYTSGTRAYRYSGGGGSMAATAPNKAAGAYVGVGARQTATSGQLCGRCYSSIIFRGMGGAQGGGGGISYSNGLGCSFLGKGGTGGTGQSAGAGGTGGLTGNAVQRAQSSGGGGGGWGASGGNGYCTCTGISRAGGAGGLAIKTGGKTLNVSGITRWGSIGT